MSRVQKIGGEMVLPDESKKSSGNIRKELESIKPHSVWLNTGRSALALALAAVKERQSRRVIWLPGFICPSVPMTCRRQGFEIKYYSIDDHLETDRQSICHIENGDVLLVVHYFGFLNSLKKEEIAAKEVILIEDAVQAAFTRGVGKMGDFVINSLRKFTPLPDGALLAANELFSSSLDEPDTAFIHDRLLGKELKKRGAPDEDFLSMFKKSEDRLDQDSVIRKMSPESAKMLTQLSIGDQEKRRHNYEVLHQAVPPIDIVSPVLPALQEGTVPLFYPIIVKDKQRDSLRKFLITSQIYCPIHWLLEDPVHADPAARELQDHILSIPIDQRYGAEDMHYVCERIKSYVASR